MSIYIKSIEGRLHFVSLWSSDIGVFFCDFTSCVSGTYCQTDRNQDKKNNTAQNLGIVCGVIKTL